jgi:hypothetical protein
VFVEIVAESKTCYIYKAVLLPIKVAARDAFGAPNDPMNKVINSIIA